MPALAGPCDSAKINPLSELYSRILLHISFIWRVSAGKIAYKTSYWKNLPSLTPVFTGSSGCPEGGGGGGGRGGEEGYTGVSIITSPPHSSLLTLSPLEPCVVSHLPPAPSPAHTSQAMQHTFPPFGPTLRPALAPLTLLSQIFTYISRVKSNLSDAMTISGAHAHLAAS